MVVVAIPLAFLAGLITAISPCVLPVLPIVLGGGDRRRPAPALRDHRRARDLLPRLDPLRLRGLLDALGLPKDLLRNISIALLFLLAGDAALPADRRAGSSSRWRGLSRRPVRRPRRRLPARLRARLRVRARAAGPAIAFVTSSAAARDFGPKTIGVARRLHARRRRSSCSQSRSAGSALTRPDPGRIDALRDRLRRRPRRGRVRARVQPRHEAPDVVPELHERPAEPRPRRAAPATTRSRRGKNVTDDKPVAHKKPTLSGLKDYGAAPDFTGIKTWLNTPGGSRSRSRSFAARSCSSTSGRTRASTACARSRTSRPGTARTRKDGFVIVGVHTPEFAFEHEVSNIRAGDPRVRRPLPGRRRQRLRHLERVRQPVLAGRVPDRRARPRPRGQVRRGRLLEDRERDPLAPGRARRGPPEGPPPRRPHAGLRGRRRSRTWASTGSSATRARRSRQGPDGEVHPPVRARPEPARLRRLLERRRAADRRGQGRATAPPLPRAQGAPRPRRHWDRCRCS